MAKGTFCVICLAPIRAERRQFGPRYCGAECRDNRTTAALAIRSAWAAFRADPEFRRAESRVVASLLRDFLPRHWRRIQNARRWSQNG
jgi:hypothetical protein